MSSKAKKKGSKPKKKQAQPPPLIPEIIGTKNLKSIPQETPDPLISVPKPKPSPTSDVSQNLQDEYATYWSSLDSFYRKLFEDDSHHMKLKSYLKIKTLNSFYSHLYTKYYKQLFLTFLNLQSESLELPGITWYQIDLVIKQCNIFNNGFDEHSVDRIFKEVILFFAEKIRSI